MNPKSLNIAVAITLVVLVANVFSVFAYRAEMPEITQAQVQPKPCQISVEAFSQVDIPARRADYNLLDRVAECTVAGLNVDVLIIPVTGAQESKYAAFKELQADLMSGGEISSNSSAKDSFYDFKVQQAEERTY